ncbi:hypothetical protein QAD02_009290 [Eretmocerus hayati]|uniref:Uncharacterized protein n=1 Tax=Eretmocerus hayati TaxID=131215 RepID=A0ACC2N964_9HYME|nr:hypothetical protein QAD02_009290 [Eretmocerus hayati]
MEWLRCNFCWVKVESQAQPFHLTQCGHIYCSKCVGKAIKRCFQCGTMDTIALPLKEPLSPQIEHYFQNSADLLDKVTSAQKFQEAQLTLCLQRGDAADAKYQALKEAYWKNNENLKKLNEKYTRLKMMVVAMQQEQKKKAAPARYTL